MQARKSRQPGVPARLPAQHLGRAGQPMEVAPAYVFLASNDSSYMSGQVLHPNGGEIING
jgi:NAD(P)-dependent dehydrogenase (short-subunit alcohol dehydrogenase family)